MNILFVSPINRSYVLMPSLGLGYLASVSRTDGHSVDILDCKKEHMSHGRFRKFLERKSYDLIGFHVFSYDLNVVKRYLSFVKEISPDTVTVAGGAHPSGDPEGTMKYLPQLDYAFAGEAEIGFPLLLRALEHGDSDFFKIPGLVYRSDGATTVNQCNAIDCLDSIPMPAWDLLKPESYPEAPHGAFTRQFPVAPIIITRGCPFPCTFCAGGSITGKQIRKRSIENVLEELRYLKNRGIREFHIEDENFTADKNLVMKFCEEMLNVKLGMSWSLPSGVRIDSLDREMLVMMERAGCYSMALGIEFGANRIMELTKKRLTVDIVRNKTAMFRGLKIKTTGFFLLGIPGETVDDMKETIKFALSLPIDRAQFNNFIPLPGSELWKRLLAEGKINHIDWDTFFVHNVAYAEAAFSPSALKRLQRKAYLRFYMRPGILIGLLKEIKTLRHLLYLLKRFFDALR